MARAAAGAASIGLALAATGVVHAHTAGPDDHTTVEQTTVAGGPLEQGKPGFRLQAAGPGEPHLVRPLGGAGAQPGRERRRRSLAYFAQLTDFQLADEESPARVEFVDQGAASAWRPQEAFHPWVIDWSFRQLNHFTAASPVTQGDGTRARMDFGLLTGDQSDNQQHNETVWVRQLVEGGQLLDPNSGTNSPHPVCPGVTEGPASRYTGVQDYDDYVNVSSAFYDPDQPAGPWAQWPEYEGLMDRAQRPFVPVGLRRGSVPVPTYATNGNHDGLVQGNEDAVREFEDIAIGCIKPIVSTFGGNPGSSESPNPNALLQQVAGTIQVPPDDARRFVDRLEMKRIYGAGSQADDHGFALVSPLENAASGFSATYYAWDPKPGLRFIGIDTVSDGGVVEQSSSGNIDDPQFRWLEAELQRAAAADKLIVVFGHHPVRSLTALVPDEAARPCTGRYQQDGSYGGQRDAHGHDLNPGCDLDPRISTPVHGGQDLANLLKRFPHVVAYVAGHTHENRVLPFEQGQSGFWEINTSATADWPQQHRLVEVMDNRDGTLSIFGTLLDQASPYALPAPTGNGAAVGAFSDEALASLGRAIAFNDPQVGDGEGEGDPPDRNVELVVRDPRAATADAEDRRRATTRRRRGGGEADGDRGGGPTARGAAAGGGGGGLPLTGLPLALLVMCGALLLAAGLALRRGSR